jgi:quercetin dioxygenase-like cupin family protein
MLQTKPLTYGNLNGSIYDAAEVGDTLLMHSHGEHDVHITIVARGSFKVHGDGWEMVAKAGDVLDWKVGQRHELIALEPNSRFVNIIKGVMTPME